MTSPFRIIRFLILEKFPYSKYLESFVSVICFLFVLSSIPPTLCMFCQWWSEIHIQAMLHLHNFIVISLYKVIYNSISKSLSVSWLNKNYFYASPLIALLKHKSPENGASQLNLGQGIQEWTKQKRPSSTNFTWPILEYLDTFYSIATLELQLAKLISLPSYWS